MIKGESSFTEARDESAEGGEAPYDSLNPLYVLDRAHFCDGWDFLWVGFNAAFGDNKAEQHAPRDPENTFFGIEFDVVHTEFHKDLLEIGNQVIGMFGLDYDVVDVGLNGSPDEVSETFEHTSLVRSPSVL